MSFAAGLTAGKLWERSAHAVASDPVAVTPPATAQPAQTDKDKDNWLAPLKMTAEQNAQMRAIWSEVGKSGPMRHKQGEALKKKKDDDFKAIMTDEQRVKYASINSKYERGNFEEWRRTQGTQERLRRERDDALKNLLSD